MKRIFLIFVLLFSLLCTGCSNDDSFECPRNGKYKTRASQDGLTIEAGEYEEMYVDGENASLMLKFAWDAGRISLYPYCNLRVKDISPRIVNSQYKDVYDRAFVADSLIVNSVNWGNYNSIHFNFSYVLQMRLKNNDSLIYRRYSVDGWTRQDVPQIVKNSHSTDDIINN